MAKAKFSSSINASLAGRAPRIEKQAIVVEDIMTPPVEIPQAKEEIETTVPEVTEAVITRKPEIKEKKIVQTERKRRGRPASGVSKTNKTYVFDDETLDMIEIASMLYNGGKSAYLTNLVKEDWEKNKKKYELLRSAKQD